MYCFRTSRMVSSPVLSPCTRNPAGLLIAIRWLSSYIISASFTQIRNLDKIHRSVFDIPVKIHFLFPDVYTGHQPPRGSHPGVKIPVINVPWACLAGYRPAFCEKDRDGIVLPAR